MARRTALIRSPRARVAGVLGATVALVAATTLVAAPAQAAPPAACGMTITSSYTLRSDLTCEGTAITVVLSPGQRITLDLGGRTLDGDGTGVGVFVSAEEGRGTVVVRNGRISGFDAGVSGTGVADLSLRDLTVTDVGAWLDHGLEVLALGVDGSAFVDAGNGGGFVESTTTVRKSRFLRSGVASPSESYTYVYDSTFIEGGVSTGDAANLVAERNMFRDCDVAIDVRDSWPSSPTIVRHNRVLGCRVGMELQVVLAGTGPTAVSVIGNEFRGNTEEGLRFAVWTDIGETVITGNRVTGNGGTGIHGTSSGLITLTRTTATGNGGHGIDVSGALDGGGNKAGGNALQPQCIGIACSR